ncbi:MAG: type II toxin-antitoxin system VapC family toxin [Rhodothermaceae bacterium]|nr:type II toxin-antitoxin system VapC family toxin [Rhodothermaceae bacterium]
MKLLLDTHTLLWWQLNPSRLSNLARSEISNPGNDVFISVITAWELQIKSQLGKLDLPHNLPELIHRQRTINGFHLITVQFEHVYELQTLPLHHKDPFDRLLMAQARKENFRFVSDDPEVKKYDVDILW